MNYNTILPPFKWFVLENFPYIEDDFDALTNWQLFCKLGKEMNKIIAKCNLTGEQVENLTNAFNSLKAYVDNYFENLDITAEVDAKLDEMAESGELAEIIAQYIELKGVLAYDTLADMKGAENIVEGSIARTLGFHSYNDKGGNYYRIRTIRNDDVVDNISIITITNSDNLVAELILGDEMYVNQYGAYGDGEHDDTDAIQYAIEKHTFGSIHFPEGTYLISEPLQTYVDNSKQCNIIMDKTTIIKTNENLDCLFELGGLGGDNASVRQRYREFKGGILDATNCTSGIKINPLAMGIGIYGTEISKFTTYGIYLPKGDNTYSSDISIRDCYINGINSAKNNYGIYIERPDNKMENLRINAVKTGVYMEQGGQFMNTIHFLAIFGSEDEGPELNFANTKAIEIHAGDQNYFDNCYCDTFCTFIESNSSGFFSLTNSTYWSYISNINCKLFNFTYATPRYVISNCSFNTPAPSTKHQGIVYTSFNTQTCLRKQLANITNNYVNTIGNFVEGDLINQCTDTYTPFWLNGTATLSTTQWMKMGYTVTSDQFIQIRVNIQGYDYIGHFKLERSSGGNTYVTARPSETSTTTYGVKLGFKYVNNTNGYNVYAVYIQQPTGTALKPDITVKQLNENIPFVAMSNIPSNPTNVTETMDATYTF